MPFRGRCGNCEAVTNQLPCPFCTPGAVHVLLDQVANGQMTTVHMARVQNRWDVRVNLGEPAKGDK